MREISVYQAFILFSWFPLSFMMAVTLLIARFYGRFSGKQTYWVGLALPIILYAVASVREANVGAPGDPAADLLYAVAGISLLVLSIRLYRMMTQTPPVMLVALPAVGIIGLGGLGTLAIAALLWVLGRLSQRMHLILQGRPYYLGYYAAAACVAVAALMRLVVPLSPELSPIYGGLLVIGVSIGAAMSWRAWSWLLAERE